MIRNKDEYFKALTLHEFLCLKPEYGGSRYSTKEKRLKVFNELVEYEWLNTWRYHFKYMWE